MADVQKDFRIFISQALAKGHEVLAAAHVGAEPKTAIRDLMHAIDLFGKQLEEAAGQSSDQRLLKRKFDQSKAELRVVQEATKKLLFTFVGELKVIINEAQDVFVRHELDNADPDYHCSLRIKASAQKMIDIIVKTAQAPTSGGNQGA